MILISIVICTHHRPDDLQRALAGFRATHAGTRSPYEIIVVENGEQSRVTRDAVAAHRDAMPIRYCNEPALGLSRARNLGLSEARGRAVAFIDDDAVPSPGWVDVHAYAYEHEDVVAAGGPVRLQWQSERPAWLSDQALQFFSHLDQGDQAHRFDTSQAPVGTNMSLRRSAALLAGGFDPRLGRRGRRLISCEESLVFHRLRSQGDIVYLPSAAVDHYVSAARLNRRWLLRRQYAQGQSELLLQQLTGLGDSRLLVQQVSRTLSRLSAAGKHTVRGRYNLWDDVQIAALELGRLSFALLPRSRR